MNTGVKNNDGKNENANVKSGSKLEVRYEVMIPIAELDRLANVDFRKYVDKDAEQKLDAPDIRKPYQNSRQLLGENFAFGQTVNVFTNMKMTVN